MTRSKEDLTSILDRFSEQYESETGRGYDPVALTTALSRIADEKLLRFVRQRLDHLAYSEIVDLATLVAERIVFAEPLPANVVEIGAPLDERPKRGRPPKSPK